MRYAVAEWAASKGLGPNIGALKTEMLCAKAILEAIFGIKIQNSALEEMLRVLQNLAHDAEGVLGELESFRIQDMLDTVNEHPKASGHNLLNATRTVKAVGKLIWSAVCTSAAATGGGEITGRTLTSGPRSISCAVSKCLPCSSVPPVQCYDDGDDSAPREHAKEKTKLVLNRVDVSKRIKLILEQLQPLRQEILPLLQIQLHQQSLALLVHESSHSNGPATVADKCSLWC